MIEKDCSKRGVAPTLDNEKMKNQNCEDEPSLSYKLTTGEAIYDEDENILTDKRGRIGMKEKIHG